MPAADVRRLALATIAFVIHELVVGGATVRLFHCGDLQADLPEWLRLRRDDWQGRYEAYCAAPITIPVQCAHISLGNSAVLIDASRYDVPLASPFALPGYQPPPPLEEQMSAAGLDPLDVEHLIITHTHFDHISGLTARDGRRYSPVYPNARTYVSRIDWEAPHFQRALRRRTSPDSQTLGVIEARGLLELVDGRRELLPGLAILPAPGETPGHQVAHLRSGGQTLYLVGDLFHHVIEVERPDWVAHWNDAAATQASRAELMEAALAEEALLMATHIPGFGRLRRTNGGVRWQSL